MKDIVGNNLLACIEELAKCTERWGCPRRCWSEVAVAEEQVVAYREAKCVIPRSALFTPERYSDRFDELLGCGYSWLNMNAIGIVKPTLIIVIEKPRNTTNVEGKTSVNYSGPRLENGKAQWDAAHFVVLT